MGGGASGTRNVCRPWPMVNQWACKYCLRWNDMVSHECEGCGAARQWCDAANPTNAPTRPPPD